MSARLALTLVTPFLAGCSTFVPVRSAQVETGGRVEVVATVATPPGEDAGWFFSLDCGATCDASGPALGVGMTVGGRTDGGWAYEVGGGLAGLFPYAEGFLQLRGGAGPIGVGGGFGLSRGAGFEDVVYRAYDLAEVDGSRVYGTTSLFRHAGRSPNGQVGGSLTALGQGFGIELGPLAPSAALVVARVGRDDYGRFRSSRTAFLVLGVRTIISW